MLIVSSLRNALTLAAVGLLALGSAACSVDRVGDSPSAPSIAIDGGISAGRGTYTFGTTGRVSLRRGLTEEKPCTLEKGEFGPYWDCTNYRDVAAKILSLECAPREACANVSFEGDRGSFLSLAEHVRVKVVADFEGRREEREADLDYVDPQVDATVAPHGWSTEVASSTNSDLAFAGGDVQVCLSSGTGVQASIEATLDGTSLTATKDPEARAPTRPCFIVRAPAAGTLSIATKLVEPARRLGTVTFPIHPLTEITDVRVRDTYCNGDGLHAVAVQGVWALGVAVVVSTASGQGLMPGYAIRAEGRTTTPKRTTPDGLLQAFFSVPGDEDTLTVVVDNGARTWTFPVSLVARCSPRTP